MFLQVEAVSPEDVWVKVDESLDVPKGQKYNEKQLITKRTGWRTVRIFVSSTFKDFHSEREMLVKEVGATARGRCSSKWSVPQ